MAEFGGLLGWAQWAWAALVVPVFAGAAWALRAWRVRNDDLARLSGMEHEQKAVLIEFVRGQRHTRQLPSADPATLQLVQWGFLERGVDVADGRAYFSVPPRKGRLLARWALNDGEALELLAEAVQRAAKERAQVAIGVRRE